MMKKVIDYLLSNDLAEIPKKRKKRIENNSNRQQEIQIQQKQTRTKCFNKETIISKENQ